MTGNRMRGPTPPPPRRGGPTVNLMQLVKLRPPVPAKKQEADFMKEIGSEVAPGGPLLKTETK